MVAGTAVVTACVQERATTRLSADQLLAFVPCKALPLAAALLHWPPKEGFVISFSGWGQHLNGRAGGDELHSWVDSLKPLQ